MPKKNSAQSLVASLLDLDALAGKLESVEYNYMKILKC